MRGFVWRRLSALPLILIGVSVLTFLLVRLVPVEPAEVILRQSNLNATEEAIAEVRSQLGLDQPLFIQYWIWTSDIVKLDFGVSYVSKLPISSEIAEKFPATLQLALSAILITVMISLPLGLLSSLFPNSWIDRATAIFIYVGTAIPRFWLGFILIYFFSLKLDWLPFQGKGGLLHLLLPSITLALAQTAVFTRLLRSQLLDQMREFYVLYAKVRGLKEGFILVHHVLRNAFSPLLAVLGISLGNMLGGTVIVEQMFSWPGMGRYLIESISNRDYPVIQCYVLLMAVVYVFINLLVDLLQQWIDPRLEQSEESGIDR